MPRWIINLIVILVFLSFIPLMMVYVARAQRNGDTRLSIIPDMDDQQKFKTQELNLLFADRRAMRPQVPDTVARGELEADDHFYRGLVNGAWATTFPNTMYVNGEPQPLVVDEQFIKRGQERYNINCAACHGYAGDGRGPVALRVEELMLAGDGQHAWTPPLSYHSDEVRKRPVGHLFNTITNGIRSMPPYGPQITPADRWAIVAYVRALQLSHSATIEDVPAEHRQQLEAAVPPSPAIPAMPAAGDSQAEGGA